MYCSSAGLLWTVQKSSREYKEGIRDQVCSSRKRWKRRRSRKHYAAGLYYMIRVHRSRKVNSQGLDALEMKSYRGKMRPVKEKNHPRSKKKQCLRWPYFHIFSIFNYWINPGIIMQHTEFESCGLPQRAGTSLHPP